MATQLFLNNVGSTVLGGTLASGATSFSVASGHGARFPAPAAEEFFLATIFELNNSGVEINHEVVKCTNRTGDMLTIVRDFENMTGTGGGYAYPSVANISGIVYIEMRWTAASASRGLAIENHPSVLASDTHAATSKTTPVDADELPLVDSAASNVLKKLTWANLKATLKTYFDTLYQAAGTYLTSSAIGSTVQAYDANTAKTNATQTWSNVQTFGDSVRGTETSLTSSSASIAVDLAAGNFFTHTFTENTTLANPSNIVAGQEGIIVFTQHASSPKTLAFGTYYKFPGGTVPTITATNSAVDVMAYYVVSSTFIACKFLQDVK